MTEKNGLLIVYFLPIVMLIYIWGGQIVWAAQKRLNSPKALVRAQQAELSALTATVFPALFPAPCSCSSA